MLEEKDEKEDDDHHQFGHAIHSDSSFHVISR